MNINYYNIGILILVILVIWIPWLWRYRIKPFSAKKELKKLLKNHPEAKELINKERFLTSLYNSTHARKVSQQERNRLGIQEDAFVYGEIEFLPFYTILDRVKPQSGEIFYDLGSGGGKALLTAACFFDFSKVYGIELLPGLCQSANTLIQKAQSNPSSYTNKLSCIHVINANFIEYDFNDGDIIFINATCLDYPSWEKLIQKFAQLKVGTRIIATTKRINHPQFIELYRSIELMSWGLNSVNFYQKIS